MAQIQIEDCCAPFSALRRSGSAFPYVNFPKALRSFCHRGKLLNLSRHATSIKLWRKGGAAPAFFPDQRTPPDPLAKPARAFSMHAIGPGRAGAMEAVG